jgi:hypothetical protein
LRDLFQMKRKRKLIGIVLLGVFLAYFSASFIFVPKAPGLQDQNTNIVKLENNEGNVTNGMFRSSVEHSEDAIKFFNYYTVSFLESFHTASNQNRLEALQNSNFGKYDIYLSIRRLQI